MSAKQYLKMADVFEQLKEQNPENEISFDLNHGYITVLACEYAAHAINSHDELVAENERLRTALECATNHSPDIAKMVAPEGWQLVPVEPTAEMAQASYKAMLAAAPKYEGGVE